MTKYDAILFDLDGTLTRSEPGITNCVQYALEKLGAPPLSLAERTRFIGPPLYESFRDLAGLDETQAQRAVDIYRERFSRVGWRENSVYEGIPDLLLTLRRQGAYLAVASAKPQPFVEKILEHFDLLRFFHRVEAIRLSDNHADKAEIVRRALPEDFARPAMVGDRRFDMEGARRRGVAAVGVSYGYGGREELLFSGADAVCDTVDELGAALGLEPFRQGALLSLPGASPELRGMACGFLRERGLPAELEPGSFIRVLGPRKGEGPDAILSPDTPSPGGDAWPDVQRLLKHWLDRRS